MALAAFVVVVVSVVVESVVAVAVAVQVIVLVVARRGRTVVVVVVQGDLGDKIPGIILDLSRDLIFRAATYDHRPPGSYIYSRS